MATGTNCACLSDTEKKMQQTEANQSQIRSETWAPLIHEIGSLVEKIHDVDNDETKSMNIIAEHTERIANAIPSNPIDIWYLKPIHRLLSMKPLKRTEIPLDVLEQLVSSGFNINDIGYDENASSDNSDGDENDVHESYETDDNDDENDNDVDTNDDIGDNDDG